jgi:hypothetical protein
MLHRSTSHRTLAPAIALRAVVDAVAVAEDEAAALHGGLTAAVTALGADAGAVIRHGAVVAATGWTATGCRGPTPGPPLRSTAATSSSCGAGAWMTASSRSCMR